MSKIILKKVNGNVEKFKYKASLVESFIPEGAKHLCWENCKNACVSRCDKINDNGKQLIGDYDYITSGLQIVSDITGEVDRFLVFGCEKYEEKQQRKLTPAESLRIKKLKESVKMLYFDAETIEEAHITQYELEKRGDIQNIRGSRPSERQIRLLKERIKFKV